MMGTYYQIACDEKKERVDPFDISDGDGELGIKAGSITRLDHPFGSVALFAGLFRWEGKPTRVVNDLSNDPGYFEYENVTAQVVESYNEMHGTKLVFTGKEE